MARLAEIIARVLKACQPVAYAGRRGPVYHAHIDFDLLEQAKWDVVDLACCVDLGADYKPSGYPHHYFMHKPTTDPGRDWDVIEIEGPHARGFCNVAMTNDVYALEAGRVPADLAAGAGWPADGRRRCSSGPATRAHASSC